MPLEKRSLLKKSTCFTVLLIIGIEQAFKYDLDATIDTKKPDYNGFGGGH
jgi:hypothetical protein